jgi:hypothetical protein
MKIKKSTMSTRLRDIYGDRTDDYAKYITVGREFWYYFTDYEITHITNSSWCKIHITYVRSGAAFYVFSDFPEIPERYFPVSSFMASILIYADIDPEKDIEFLGNMKNAKLKYRFDDERTVVHNWPNEKEVEVDESEIDYFDSLLSV